MVTVAERMTTGIIPMPRTRFNALVITGVEQRRAALSARMRSLGARDVVEAATVGEARAAVTNGPLQGHDCCIIDGTSADEPVIPLMAFLRNAGWRRLLLLSGRSDPPAVRAAMLSGARAFVVLKDEEVVAPEPVVRTRTRGGAPDELSSREVEVLQLVAEGQSNKDIGEQLSLSALTVKSHLARIARKLGTGDRAEMVAMSVRAGLVR